MIYCNNDSNCREVTTQADLDVYANDGKTCVHIVGGENLVINGEMSVKYVSDNGTVESVSGNGTVESVSGNGTVEYVSDNGTVKYVSDNGTVKSVSGNGTVKYVSDNGTVKYVYGNGTVESVSDNGTVESVSGNGTVKYVSGNGTVEKARGAAIIRVSGTGSVIDAGPYVTVVVHGLRTKVVGGVVHQMPEIKTPAEWCDFYGVDVVDGAQFKPELVGVQVAVLYKALNDGFKAHWNGFEYLPGTEPEAPDWDGGATECGNGLHFSPWPSAGHRFNVNATCYVGCPVRLDDIVVHPDGRYPDKVKAPRVCAPVFEVDIDGEPIITEVAQS